MRIACVGEAMIELSMHDGSAAVGVAGDTLNTAIYLKRAAPDIHVEYVTRLGDDPFSQRISGFISDHGIGVGNIEVADGKSPGLYAITTTDAGERSFTYWRSASAARDMFQGANGPDFSGLTGYDLVYLSGISLAILPPPVRNQLVDFLTHSGLRLAYDSNYRPRLWESREAAQSATAAMWRRADIALPSIDDEMELFAETPAQVVARMSGCPGTGALKRGAEGPLSLGEPVDQSYAPAPRVVDTTAAGDSFNGAYLGALLGGASQAEALRAGHDCAAHVVQHRGAIAPA